MVPPIHLGAWSMALMLWLPFELLQTGLRASGGSLQRDCPVPVTGSINCNTRGCMTMEPRTGPSLATVSLSQLSDVGQYIGSGTFSVERTISVLVS